MANTTNYNFEKPAQTDYYDVEVQNNNWDKLDTELKKTNGNKQDKLVSGVTIKTINGESLLGSGNIFIKGGTLSEEVTAKRADVLKGKTTIMNDSADEIVEGTLEVQSIVNFNLSLYASETVMGAWQKPAKGPYSGVRVVYRTDRYPNNPDDGTLAYEGNGINFTKTLPAGTKHYFAAFSYMNTNIGKIYSDVAAKAEFTTSKVQGRQVFKSNGTFTVPTGCRNVQVFLVGGGGAGYCNYRGQGQSDNGGGGGGGYTNTTSINVTPGQKINVIVGAGGSSGNNWANAGGSSQFGSVTASGGAVGQFRNGGNGGSGGGGGGLPNPGSGASNGGKGDDGKNTKWGIVSTGGNGQGRSTKDWDGTLYSGGGGGGGGVTDGGRQGAAGGSGGGGRGCNGGYGKGGWNAGAGSPNTGGGGGGGGGASSSDGASGGPGAAGGSGIVIVRWGY